MEDEFMNEDVKRVMNKLMQRMKEAGESMSFTTEVSKDSKSTDPSIDSPGDGTAISDTLKSPEKPKTIKPKEFIEITLARMNGIKQKSVDNIKKILETKAKDEVAELKKKPEINKNSQKIGKRNKPLFERAQDEKDESKKNLETVKAKLEAERNKKIEPDLTFKPKINGKITKKRTNEEFFKYNLEWTERKTKKTEAKRKEIEDKVNEELKFTPEIDNNSATIVDSLGPKRPIEERLLEKMEYNKKKKQAMRDEQLFTFTPVIEENSRNIAKHKYEGDVFNRLFSLAKEQETPTKSPKNEVKKNRSFSFSNDLEDDPQKKLDFLFDLSS